MTSPREYDPVQEYLKTRDCPSHVVKAGLKGLVLTWEKVVAELVFDGYRYGLGDLVKDLDRRELLASALGQPGAELPPSLATRLEAADKRFVDATRAASRCLVDDGAASARGLTRERDWWYYRIPRRSRPNFAADLERAGIVALD